MFLAVSDCSLFEPISMEERRGINVQSCLINAGTMAGGRGFHPLLSRGGRSVFPFNEPVHKIAGVVHNLIELLVHRNSPILLARLPPPAPPRL